MRSIISCSVLALASLPAIAQSSSLYMTRFIDGSVPSEGLIIQNGAVQSTFAHVSAPRQYGLAVADDVRTVDYFGSGIGGQYSLGGASLGGVYSHNSPNGDVIVDGTTDGVSANFAGGYFSGNVYAYDRNWNGVQTLFTVPNATHISGITYDSGNGSLWVYASGSGLIREYSLSGQELNAFQVSVNTDDVFLAFEPSSQTIWMYPRSSRELRQYSRAGALLDTEIIGFQSEVLGMEFAIPAPGAGALLGLGGLALSRRRRA